MFKIKVFLLGLMGCFWAAHSALDRSDTGTLQFARNLVGKYKEVDWLLDLRVKATLQGEKGIPESSWSVQITSEKEDKGHCIEFERTVHSVLCLHVFKQGGMMPIGGLSKAKKHTLSPAKTSIKYLRLLERLLTNMALI